MSEGYIYCLSNASMPGMLKIGMTRRTIDERLKEANRRDTFKPPTKYVIEVYKRVNEPSKVEKMIHILLERERVDTRREFFRVSIESVKAIFDTIEEACECASTTNTSVANPTSILNNRKHKYIASDYIVKTLRKKCPNDRVRLIGSVSKYISYDSFINVLNLFDINDNRLDTMFCRQLDGLLHIPELQQQLNEWLKS